VHVSDDPRRRARTESTHGAQAHQRQDLSAACQEQADHGEGSVDPNLVLMVVLVWLLLSSLRRD
jgi:hypothetical protein